jgi:amidase
MAYDILERNPGGSSTRSAVGVSAGFAPLAIGTETIGSLVVPADRAAIYTLKPTLGMVSQEGLIPVSHLYDTAGPMTKCARDLALLLDVLVDPARTNIPEGEYLASVIASWDRIRVGVLKPSDWYLRDPPLKYVKEAEYQMVFVFDRDYYGFKRG